jgi:ERF superfamily protein
MTISTPDGTKAADTAGHVSELATPDKRRLVAKLAEVMTAVERIPKRGHNVHFNYDYATEADIVAAIRLELAKRHVMLLPAVTAMQRDPVGEKGNVLTTLIMDFTFMDGESGAEITRPWIGAGTDTADKGCYKAVTGGAKFFLLKTFLVPTGDDPEAEQPAARTPVKAIPKAVVAPDGYVKWLHGMSAAAGEGIDRLHAEWNLAKKEYRQHLETTDPKHRETLKAVAAKVDDAKRAAAMPMPVAR